ILQARLQAEKARQEAEEKARQASIEAELIIKRKVDEETKIRSDPLDNLSGTWYNTMAPYYVNDIYIEDNGKNSINVSWIYKIFRYNYPFNIQTRDSNGINSRGIQNPSIILSTKDGITLQFGNYEYKRLTDTIRNYAARNLKDGQVQLTPPSMKSGTLAGQVESPPAVYGEIQKNVPMGDLSGSWYNSDDPISHNIELKDCAISDCDIYSVYGPVIQVSGLYKDDMNSKFIFNVTNRTSNSLEATTASNKQLLISNGILYINENKYKKKTITDNLLTNLSGKWRNMSAPDEKNDILIRDDEKNYITVRWISKNLEYSFYIQTRNGNGIYSSSIRNPSLILTTKDGLNLQFGNYKYKRLTNAVIQEYAAMKNLQDGQVELTPPAVMGETNIHYVGCLHNPERGADYILPYASSLGDFKTWEECKAITDEKDFLIFGLSVDPHIIEPEEKKKQSKGQCWYGNILKTKNPSTNCFSMPDGKNIGEDQRSIAVYSKV
ncbi:MAG: hypothetical protein MUO21_03620, partial [Nitrososphaeraceae archaeon]|nr:hypothetical protein [Nitrososphaeraceae archaeon]